MQPEIPQDIAREALDALRWFVDLVESGKVFDRSPHTKFKEILDKYYGVTARPV